VGGQAAGATVAVAAREDRAPLKPKWPRPTDLQGIRPTAALKQQHGLVLGCGQSGVRVPCLLRSRLGPAAGESR